MKLFKRYFFLCLLFIAACEKNDNPPTPPPPPPPPAVGAAVDYWFTKADKSQLIMKQTAALNFKSQAASGTVIEVDSATQFQAMDGFGYTLTGGSATLINRLPAAARSALLNDLFTTEGIGISYLRLSIGASDLDAAVFSYNDMPAGQTDPNLTNFSLSKDTVDLIPLLKQILLINPSIKLMGSPWSPPAWMKDNGQSIGGKLLPQYYAAYANYFKKYLQAMQANGITIDAITVQNEPENPNNNPSMSMTVTEQANFIKNNLGPVFRDAGLKTKIIIFDHNADHPEYPVSILNDASAKDFVDGSAFHLYAGDIAALSAVHNAHPDKNIYFTEQWTSSTGSFDGDLQWHYKNVIIGATRNWAKVVLEWNLANDANFGPHTPGGCTQCKGALTISGAAVEKNVSYYIIGQVAKFVLPGSRRIQSTTGVLKTVAFLRPDGKKVLVVLNEEGSSIGFQIKANNQVAVTNIPAKTVATFVW